MTRFKRLAKEGSWIVVGQIMSVTASLVLVRVLTEHLAPAQYGQLALGLTVAGLINQVLMGGIIAGIGRFYSIAAEMHDLHGYLRASRRLMGYATLAAFFTGLVMMGGLFWLKYSHWLGLGAAALFFSIISAYNASLSGIQNAARQRAVVAFHGGLDGWLKILLAVAVMLWLGNTSTATVIGYACSALMVTGSQFIFLQRLIKRPSNPGGVDNQWIHKMWTYSWPMAAAGLFNWGYYASQRWALELFTSSADVGHFYALTQIAYTPLSMAGGMALSFLTPILFTRAGSATDHDRLRNTQRVIIRIALLGFGCTLLIAGISFFVHDLIFQFLVASEYRQMSVYMPYVILAAGILSVSQALAVIIAIENQTRRFLPLAIIGNGGIAALNLYLTYRWGIEGLIASMVLGAGIHFTWMLKLSLKNVNRVKIIGKWV